MPTIQLAVAPGATRPATHELKGGVEWRDGAPARHQPRHAAPDQQAAQRHDEGRNLEIGDNEALERADHEAEHHAGSQCDDPYPGISKLEPHDPDEEFGLRDAHHHADHAFDGADRKIDVAHHDDQHHGGRHDRDRGGLHRQVPEVARREEKPARQEVDSNPDDQQRADHAEHAYVELGCLEKAADRAELGFTRPIGACIGGRRVGSCVGHDVLPPGCRLPRMPEAVWKLSARSGKTILFEKTPRREAATFQASCEGRISCRPGPCPPPRRRRPLPS